MCLCCSLVGGQGIVLCGNSQNDRHCCKILDRCLPPLAEKEGSVGYDKGKEKGTARQVGGRRRERAGGLKREEKNREKLVRATTAGRQAKGRNLRWEKRGVGEWGGRESRSGRMDRGRDRMHGAGRCAALHLHRKRQGDIGGKGGKGFRLGKRLKSSRA